MLLKKILEVFVREEQLAFPRGFGEMDKAGNPIEELKNAVKELKEELGCKVSKEPIFLGRIAPDSGIIGSKVDVFKVAISEYKVRNGYESIIDVISYTKLELEEAIRDKKNNGWFYIGSVGYGY